MIADKGEAKRLLEQLRKGTLSGNPTAAKRMLVG